MNPSFEKSEEVGRRSPCVGQCQLNGSQICSGCFRSRQEIGCWSVACVREKERIIERANARRKAAKPSVF
ncbi:DUF1289 domain-containing protein [Novipirellula artificiosorum]|uniref:DUF1289 domain-containing protein n=1 Tax=Novipirellula artificiosorum TaxID=2528016 RepID=A0A5C6E285_9BACT|nr:DUF1289 domain-containing protein [Novipirellula artificiosorum]TWU42087.1 hypothetical protein Poly41_03830 [Novipirellula artificiosorum]